MRRPSLEELQRQVEEEGGCEATDGCFVEPDGSCEHQQPSWLLASASSNPNPLSRQEQMSPPPPHKEASMPYRNLWLIDMGDDTWAVCCTACRRALYRGPKHIADRAFAGHRCEPVLPLNRRRRPA